MAPPLLRGIQEAGVLAGIPSAGPHQEHPKQPQAEWRGGPEGRQAAGTGRQTGSRAASSAIELDLWRDDHGMPSLCSLGSFPTGMPVPLGMLKSQPCPAAVAGQARLVTPALLWASGPPLIPSRPHGTGPQGAGVKLCGAMAPVPRPGERRLGLSSEDRREYRGGRAVTAAARGHGAACRTHSGAAS